MQHQTKALRMSTIQMHYDGWFTLPAAARQKFHLTTGDRLEVELAGDTIVLRPARGTAAPGHATAEQAPAAPEEPAVVAEPAAAAAPAPVPEPVAKRGPGRPRKVPAAAALPPGLKTRGRRKGAPTVEALARQ
jgi:AbrB family looped-hinge helix DNA binding protein